VVVSPFFNAFFSFCLALDFFLFFLPFNGSFVNLISSLITLFITRDGTTVSVLSLGELLSSDELLSCSSAAAAGLCCSALPVLLVLLVLVSHDFVFPEFPITSFLRLFWNQI